MRAATGERAVGALAAPIEAPIDAVATCVEPFGGQVAAVRFGAVRGAVEARIGAVAALVEAVFDAVASSIEPLLDAVAALVGALGGVRENLRRASQQSQSEPYCTAFHCRPP